MSLESKYEFLVILITAILALELLAKLLRLPPAVALIAGGMALALVPGVPEIDIDPDFVMVVFLPPLLMSSAYFTVWREIRRHFWAIASLALGAVAFTTLKCRLRISSSSTAIPFGRRICARCDRFTTRCGSGWRDLGTTQSAQSDYRCS